MLGILQRKWALPLVAFAGIVITVLIVKLQPDMVHEVQDHAPVPVNVIEVTRQSLKPAIIGFGTVKPSLNLQVKAEVTGRVTYQNPELKKGEILPAGTLVLTIDDTDYRLALEQARADLLAAQAGLKENDLAISNNKLDLQLANQKLKVRSDEWERLSRLHKQGALSQSRLDQEKQARLQQQQEVQSLENQRTTLPIQRKILESQLAIAQAKLERSKRDLARTRLTLPFDGRISQVYTEKNQLVSTGNNLFDAIGLEKIEVNAQFPIDQFSRFASDFGSVEIDFSNQASFPSMDKLLKQLELTATVELPGSNYQPWQAKVERVSDTLDPQTRTVGVTVSVSDSYQNAKPGVQPPLLEGMFTQVTLLGKSGSYLVMPRFAVHKHQVYAVTPENTLQRKDLTNVQLQGDLAIVNAHNGQDSAVQEGEKIIVSDVFPAVSGMSVEPVIDTKLSGELSGWVESAQ